jgi:hypothetical protein
LVVTGEVDVTDPPTEEELHILRDLKQRTEAAHAG